MTIKGINHITFSVSDMDASIAFYSTVFDAILLYRDERTAYFDLAGLWFALNAQENIARHEIRKSYTHTAFTIDRCDMEHMERRLQALNVPILPGRPRDAGEGISLYFRDPDGHLFEFHAGDRESRLRAYQTTPIGSDRPESEL